MNYDEKVTKRMLRAMVVRAEGEGEGKKIRLSFSSETPCPDYVYYKGQCCRANVKLSHAEGDVDFSRIKDGIPLKDTHESETVIARAMNCRLEDGKLVSDEIIWSAAPRAAELKADIESGVMRDMSIEAVYGYDQMTVESMDEDETLNVVVKGWLPLAAAFVTVGADPEVGVNRSLKPATEAPVVEPVTSPASQAGTEVKHNMNKKMFDLCRQFGVPDETIGAWLDEGITVEVARERIMDEGFATSRAAAQPAKQVPAIGMDKKDVERYSLLRAIRSRLPVNDPDYIEAGFESDCSKEVARKLGKNPKGLYIPLEVLTRSFNSGSDVGGKLIPTEFLGQAFVEIIRNKLVLDKLGVGYLTGLKGDVEIPKQTGSVTGYWIDNESSQITASNPTIGQLALTPHTCGAYTEITRKMLLQTDNPSADALVQNDIIEVVARMIQKAALYGSGTSGQPTGLATLLSASKRTNALSFAEVVAMESLIESPNEDNVKWLCNPAVFGTMRTTSRDAGSGEFIARKNGLVREVADTAAFVTKDVSADQAFVGDFSQLLIAMWGTLDIAVDPLADIRSGKLAISGLQDIDIAVRHTESFAWAEFSSGD